MGKEVGKSMATVDERVKKIIAEQLGVEEEEVTLEAHFVEDLGADSLDTVELVMALEEEFEIEILLHSNQYSLKSEISTFQNLHFVLKFYFV